MMKTMMIASVSLMAFFLPSKAQTHQNVILPNPSKVEFTDGYCKPLAQSVIGISSSKASKSADYLAEVLQSRFGLAVNSKKVQNSLPITLLNSRKDDASEAYRLAVTPLGISIEADSEKGVFYGIQSLLQIIECAGDKALPCQVVDDKPRFHWRAFMLDEARYFKGEKEVIQLLDVMAELKMNVFHWHLTDDQGWRYESKKYPLLTEVGSKRKDTQIGGWNSEKRSGEPHEGFYTQEQIRRIVEYANARHIKVVPEIEMPGHASAAIAAYPWLGSSKQEIEVPVTFGKHYNTYNVTDPKVIKFLQNIVAEAISLFNTDVIHIGGDEVRFNHWEGNPDIVRYKEKKGFSSYMDIQIEATNNMSRFIAGKKASMMGWNEILGKNLHADDKIAFSNPSQKIASNVIVHFWKGDLNEIRIAAQEGYRLVNSYHSYTYLDYSYQDVPLKKAYHFEPIPEGLPVELQKNIYGIGCQMWSEWIPLVSDMHRQIFPRIGAYAEVGWSCPEKNYDDFIRRLKIMNNLWTKRGIVGFWVPELQ
ncbi:MAG: beta-N-acetylhexosaminidase [Breznakibacter sp.]